MKRARLVLVLLAALPAGSIAETMYKWVDEKGVTHYSSDPPPEASKARKIDVQPTPPSVPSAPQSAASWKDRARELENERRDKEQAEAKAGDAQKRQEAQRRDRCRRARVAIDQLNAGVPLYRYDAKGERQYVTDEQRAAEMESAKKAAAESC